MRLAGIIYLYDLTHCRFDSSVELGGSMLISAKLQKNIVFALTHSNTPSTVLEKELRKERMISPTAKMMRFNNDSESASNVTKEVLQGESVELGIFIKELTDLLQKDRKEIKKSQKGFLLRLISRVSEFSSCDSLV